MHRKTLTKSIPFVVVLAVLPSLAFCLDIHSKAGTTGFGFLRIGPGARAVAMGNAFTGVTGDIYSSYWNPAGLARIEQSQATATYLNYLLDIQSGYLGYARPCAKAGVFGLTLQYMNFGDLDKTDETGTVTGTFAASDVSLSISYGRTLREDLSIGATFSPLIHENIDEYSSLAMAFSLGAQYELPVEGGLTIGAAVQHLGATLKGFTDEHKDDLPLNFRLGGGLHLAHLPVLLACDANKAIDQDFKLSLGGEITPHENLAIRLGYRFNNSDLKLGTGKDDYIGLSGGFGLVLRQYTVDYALSSFGELGLVHQVTISAAL